MEERYRRLQYLVTVSVSVAFVALGVSSSWITPVLPELKSGKNIHLTDTEVSWLMALNAPSFLVGSLASRFISDKYGRRMTIIVSSAPYAIGTLIIAFSKEAWLIYVAVFMWNCSTGLISTVIGIYLAEIADKDIRGRLSVGTRFTYNFGSFLMMLIGPLVSYKALNYSLLVLPICYFLGCWWIPETPYFYLKEKKVDAARTELSKLRRYKTEKTLEDELKALQENVGKEMTRSSTVMELFTNRRYWKAITISSGLKITQIMTGLMTIQQYLALIIKESQLQMETSTVIIVFGAVRFVVSILSSLLIDKVGRRPLLIFSYFGTSASLAMVGVYYFCQEVIKVDRSILITFGFVPFLGITLANIISTVGFNTLVAVIPPELFPMNVKSIAMTSLNVFGAALGFVVSKTYQNIKNVGGLCTVFWIYAGVACVGAIFVYGVVPETKDKDLGQIQMELQGAKETDEYATGVTLEANDKTEAVELEDLVDKNKV